MRSKEELELLQRLIVSDMYIEPTESLVMSLATVTWCLKQIAHEIPDIPPTAAAPLQKVIEFIDAGVMEFSSEN